MAELQIVFWRDIPAQIIVRQGRKTARRELSTRFIEAVDRCAMRVGAKDTDAYLGEWRRGTSPLEAQDLESEADRAMARIEEDYTGERLKALVANEGREP